jgi:hypothetical protein
MLLAKPIARLTIVPFAMLAPFMIVIIYFAAYQATRSWFDLVTLFVLGVLGVYMKRFGWSPPALLIGFVLANRLDASVYQSIQVYGFSFLERGGVQVMLALIAISIFLAARMKPHREALSADGPHKPVERGPQAVFLGIVIACVLFAMYDMSHLAFLGKVFPMSVGLITAALLAAIAVVFLRGKPSYAFCDTEHAATTDPPAHSELHVQAWILGLLAATALVGFILGVLIYIAVFLRIKAGTRWSMALLSGLGAAAVLAGFGHFMVLDYPGGLLQHFFELPWPFD